MVNLKIQIPQDFFKEETICDYLVSKEMKEIWAVELDLLSEFDRVCTKYNIKYFASGGTLLGAIRHHGFIPWDDDIDLAMARKDYEKLCEIAPKEFIHPFFFQTEYTDPGSLRGHAQLRNSLTTGIIKNEYQLKKKINQGIFIDIFPLDGVPDDQEKYDTFEQQAVELKRAFRRCSLFAYPGALDIKSYKSIIKNVGALLASKYCKKKTEELYKRFEEVCSMYNEEETEFLSMLTFRFSDKRLYIEKRFLGDIERVKFEFITIPVLKGYDALLKRQYGDYMVMKKASSYHGGVFFDTNRSYKEYV
jgi:lipopolysaccharide cholinephosphotransferase